MTGLFDTPDPPDPRTTSAAQTATNVNTAIANANLGNVNQVTPQGSLSFDQRGTYAFVDPASGLTYNIPQFTATQTPSPILSQADTDNQWTQANLARLGNIRSQQLQNQYSAPIDVNQAPQAGNPAQLSGAPMAQTGFGDVGNPQFGFGAAGDIDRTFGAAPNVQGTFGEAGDITRSYQDFAGERNRVEEALLGRLQPGLDIERNRYEQQLADQGIRYGSPAYENAMRNYSMQANDARLAAIGAAGSEQQRMSDIAAQRAGFQNAAQQQAYQQAAGRGEFWNKAQQQIFEQARARGQFSNEAQQQLFAELLGRGQFTNAAQQQAFGQAASRGTFANAALAQNFQQQQSAFNAQNAARAQYLNEQYTLRNQPINEITALLSGSQVHQPNFINANMPTIPTTDVAGQINRNFDQQMAAFGQMSQNANNIIGGLFGLGGSLGRGALASDRAIKHDVHKMGSVWGVDPEGEEKQLPIYSYKYKADPSQSTRVGPMAQDVEKIDKSAVRKIGGVKHIDLPKLGEILKAA